MPVQQPIRPAGSTPCVGANNSFNVRDNNADPEQGIYHGLYRLGMWICIADRDVWRRQDLIHDQGMEKKTFKILKIIIKFYVCFST